MTRRWHPRGQSSRRVPVLYIAGAGRSGTTLLDRILGHTDSVFAAGEIRLLWTGALKLDGRCGCGDKLRSCEVWSEVFREAFGGFDEAELRHMLELEKRMRTRWYPLAASTPSWNLLLDRLEDYPDRVAALYDAISKVTGCELIVDASKDSMYAAILCSRPTIDLTMVHVLRDPRAAAYSWMRTKPDPGDGGAPMERYHPIHSTAVWMALNHDNTRFGAAFPDRYLQIRYEDFVPNARDTLRAIGTLVGTRFDESVFLDDTTLSLGPTHSAWGNANRFEHGTTQLRVDREWEDKMSPRTRAVVTSMAALQLHSYGYER